MFDLLMDNVRTSIEEIKAMTPAQRVAGYLVRVAAVAECGAKLRAIHANDDDWTDDEESEWDEVRNATMTWFDAMSDEELEACETFDNALATLCRGEWPLPKPLDQIPDVIKRECKSCGAMDYLTDNKCKGCE
jgi:hypothetical protein